MTPPSLVPEKVNARSFCESVYCLSIIQSHGYGFQRHGYHGDFVRDFDR